MARRTAQARQQLYSFKILVIIMAQKERTVLPDGSAFKVQSWPLSKDHWLYAPRSEWDNERDEDAECPKPILTNAQREAVIAAARYAIRGATMCGQECDFDPDALVQNFAYALCGPCGMPPQPPCF